MERTIKQSIISLVFEYLFKFIVLSVISIVLINFAAELNRMSIFQDRENVEFGVMILLFVFLSYRLYRKADQEILKDIDRLIENLRYDSYRSNLKLSEIKSIQDIFERKNREIQEKDKLISRTISYLGHDMKTPLTIINTNISLLKRNKNFSDDDKKRVARIECESEKLSEYISGLMDVTNSLTVDNSKEKLSLRPLLQKLTKNILIFSDAIEEEITINNNIENVSDAIVPGNFKKLEKCLIHLINNALEHKKQKIKVEFYNDRKYIFINIIDDGRGFKEESLKRAKEIFYTDNYGRTSGKGYGIGLYFVDSYMNSIGGELILKNRGNNGASQMMKIPYSKADGNG